ncbi:MAG TPA: hypothetical protein VF593_10375, partial [Chthoniobacteraceae bacterium]
TLHHNWFEHIDDRTPRARFGNIHCFNNVVVAAENAVMSVMGAATLVEHCFFRDVRIATSFSHAKDLASEGKGGRLSILESRNVDPRPRTSPKTEGEAFEQEHNFTNSPELEPFEFNAPAAAFPWPDRRRPPYSAAIDPVDEVPALVEKFAGTFKQAVQSAEGAK